MLHGAGVLPVRDIVSHIPDHAEYLLLFGNKCTVQKGGALNETSAWATKMTLWKWLFTVPAPSFHSLHCEHRPIPRLYLPLVRAIVCVALSLQHKLVRLSNQCRVLQASWRWYVCSLKRPFHREGYLGWLPHLLLSQKINLLLRSHLHAGPLNSQQTHREVG